MSDGGPTVTAAASSAGIASIRRQFELRVDAVCEPPIKPTVKPRPASFRDPKTVFAKSPPDASSDRPSQIHSLTPKQRKAAALSGLTPMPHPNPFSSSSSIFSSSFSLPSTSSSSSQVHPKQPTVVAAAGSDRTTSQETNHTQLQHIPESCDEGSATDFLGHSQGTDIPKTPEFLPTDVNTTKDIDESGPECGEAEANCKLKTECTASGVVGTPTCDRSIEMNSDTKSIDCNIDDSSVVSTSASNPSEEKSLSEVVESKDEPSVKPAQYCAKQMILEETHADRKSLNAKTSSSSNTTPRKWMQGTRSLENLCSSSAGTPTEELHIFREKKPKANDALLTATASDADVVTSSQSLDRSRSLASKPKSPVRAKKVPPPPVPKKIAKFTAAPKSCLSVGDEATGDSNTNKKLSSEDDNSSIQSEATPGCGSLRSLSSSEPQTKKKVPRPKTLFPSTSTMTVCPAVESDHEKYTTLPTPSFLNQIHTKGQYVLGNRKDTLFPCNRQKPRAQMLLESSDLGADLSPEFYRRRGIGENQSLLMSPMSLGNRTPPDIDFLTANTEDRVADGHRSSPVSSDCPLVNPLPTPVNSEMCHVARVESDSASPPPNSDDKTSDAASAADQQMSDINQSAEALDADSFLEDAFEFLSCEAQPIEDGIMMSSLKSWTDTWCKNGTKNPSETPLRESTTGSAVDDGRKGDKNSTRGDNSDQDRTEKSNSQTVGKTEEGRQKTAESDKRASEDKQGASRKGSSVFRNDPKAPEDPKAADTEQPNPFGVVLRQSSTYSMRRRSALVSPSVSNNPTASSPSAAGPELDSRSSATVRPSSTAKTLSRLPSLPSLTILPTNRPVTKSPGKYIGGKPSVILDGNSSNQAYKKTDLEAAVEAIDKAFEFLDDSGA